jgi:amino acid adenylation domain-containing protein
MSEIDPKYAENLSPRQRKLLELMLKGKGGPAQPERLAGERGAIPRRSPADPPVLSFAQQRLWFIQQLQPGTAAYNIPSGVRLKGPLDARLFERALAETVRRHETLRTTFALVEDRPLQLVAPDVSVVLPIVDLAGLSAERREREAQQVVNGLARKPFDLVAAPPWQAVLVRVDGEDHVFLAVMHHIISDTWTTGVFFREMVAHYRAGLEHRQAQVPSLPVQYADYASWQSRRLGEGGVLQRQVAYWQQRFVGAPPLLALPTDRPRPAVSSFRGGRITLLLPSSLTDRLRALSTGEDATLFMTLMAAYQLLLLRHTGEEDVLVGTPMANRNRMELEHLIGVFVNTLVLRTDFTGNPPFRALLKQVRETTLEGLSNHDVPFEKVVEALQLERDTSRNPLFQALFAFQNVPIPALVAQGLTLSRFEFEETTARLDIELDLQEMPYGFVGWIGFSADLFDASSIARWARGFLLLLEGLAAQPDLPVWDLPLLAPAERHQLALEWNREAVDLGPDGLDERFAAQVARATEAVAVTAEGGSLTYGELDRRARRLARRLRAEGVGPETRVGLCAERSLEMVVGMLAVIQAGGAYVPLDPDYPHDRLAFLLADARPAVVLVQEQLKDRLPEAPGVRRVLLGEEAGGEGAEAGEPPLPALPGRAGLAAYVIYTSGSTGTPKGVVVTHGNVTRLFAATAEDFRFGPADVWTFFHSFAFDFSVWEIWGALLHGGRLVVVPFAVSRSPESFALLLASEGVTVLNQTPSAFQQLLPIATAGDLGRGLGLRLVIFGGEALTLDRLAPWFARFGDRTPRLVNMYGITETTVHVTFRPLGIGDLRPGVGSVIGLPLSDLQVHLLDRRLQPVPIGVPGEIHVGGAGLARGYLGRPDLTAERFVPDPFGAGLGSPGSRLYRSGDLARRRVDGEIEVLGRADQQVKIRGYRIELGEIEAVLGRHPGVRELALVALVASGARGAGDGDAGERRLVAYVVPRPGQAPNVSELHAFLKERLPDYMVPAAFVLLDALPVNANGKLDRRALPAPDGERPDLGADYADPEGEIERRIALLWRKVLGVERIGRNDNFFELGGHSLLLTQVHRELKETAPELTLIDLFSYPTVGALADYLSSRSGRRSAADEARERAEARRATHAGESESDIAIVGMALRFPGADTPERFWQNLKDGVESISFFSREEVLAAGVSAERVDDPAYVRAEGDLSGVEMFDPEFFGYDPAEAEVLDPQHRIFMECAWEVLERAGYDPAVYGKGSGVIGIFAGVNISSYLFSNLYDYDPMNVMSSFLTRIGLLVGNQNDFLCTRVAYQLDLRGPAIAVQTACSTATVATHLACQSLIRRECDMCLAGGVQIRVPQGMGYLYQEGGFPSPDGHCRSFDAKGQGNVHGNGSGVLLLKRLADAVRDGDHIHAVIKGSAVSNDGSVKVGFTAPGVDGQVRAAAEALAVAGVHPESIGYLEATGTATELGDPIEIEALTRAYGGGIGGIGGIGGGGKKGYCPIGSVKSNIGHTDAASGAAALIKCALVLERELIPPSLHFETPNPRIDFANSPFFVNAALRPWPRSPISPISQGGETPRRAAVHIYAVGGTNAHLILEEPPLAEPAGDSRPWQLLRLSARTSAALHAATENLAGYLASPAPASLPDIAYTLTVGRRQFAARRTVLCREVADAVASLTSLDPERVSTGLSDDERRSVALILPGDPGAEAALRPACGELYAAEAGFRAGIDRCAEILTPLLGLDLRPLLGCGVPEAPGAPENVAGAPLDPRQAEPALFAFEYALAQLWMEWGVKPGAVLGWGVGELVAACLAGVLSLADALALAVVRGRVLAGCPSGSRLEVELAEAPLAEHLREGGEGIAVEAVLSPTRCRVAGPEAAIEALQQRLNELGVDCFHLGSGRLVSALDGPAREAYRQALDQVTFEPPTLALIASETGAPLKREEAVRTAFWERQLRATVRLGEGLRGLADDRQTLLLGVGPEERMPDTGRVLASLGGAMGLPAPARLLSALGELWVAGVELDGPGFYRHERRLRVPLPTYPFERRRIWAEPKIGRDQAIWSRTAKGGRREMAEWFYAPSWRRSEQPAPSGAAVPEGTWLILVDASGLGDRLAERLRAAGRDAVTVRPDLCFYKDAPGEYRIDPWRFEDYASVLTDLARGGRASAGVAGVVHLFGVAPHEGAELGGPERSQDLTFWSLHHLARALGERATGPIRFEVVACGTQEITGEEEIHPERAACLSAAKVIPWEYPDLLCRSIDVVAPAPGTPRERRLLDQLLGELARDPAEPVVAYRGGHRWVQSAERLAVETVGAVGVMEKPAGPPARLREGGVYLVVGGVGGAGGFGRLVADYLARTVKARLALIGDTALPPRESWDAWLEGAVDGDDETARLLRQIRRWEELGAEVLLADADLADPGQVGAAVGAARARFGALHGVFYAAAEPSAEMARRIADLDRDFYEYRLRSRLSGLLALAESLGEEELDFVQLASTVASVTGGPAAAVDCLADTFLDLFARQQSRRGPALWTSVDWDAFRLPGGGGSPSTAITPEEGTAAFASLLALGRLQQVVVSTVDLAERLVTAREGGRESARENAPAARERPLLRTPYVAPRNEVEREVAGIWAEVLGMREVGVEDDFFDLGGNSLVATQLVSRLRGALQVNLALQDFFEGATVAALAERVRVTRWAFQAMSGPEAAGAIGAMEEVGEI